MSRSPPNCGEVSSTTSLANDIVSILGLVPSFAAANTIEVPLFVAEKVKVDPEPDAYLN